MGYCRYDHAGRINELIDLLERRKEEEEKSGKEVEDVTMQSYNEDHVGPAS